MTNRVNVLGVGISVLNLKTALAAIADAVRERRKGYICVTGVHGVMEAQDDASFKKILNESFLCTPDGMPMVWAGKLNGQREMRRVYGPDLMLDLCAWSENSGCKHFFYGGADGVAELLAQKLKLKFPKLKVVGTFTPPFRACWENFLRHVAEDAPYATTLVAGAKAVQLADLAYQSVAQNRWMDVPELSL